MKRYDSTTIYTGVIRNISLATGKVTYRFTVPMGMTIDGKQQRKTKTYTPNRAWSMNKSDKEAIKEYNRFFDYCKTYGMVNDNARFIDLYNEYKTYASGKLKKSSMARKDYEVSHHILPIIGNMRLNEIKTQTITRMLSDIQIKNNLSKGTITNIKNHASSIFKYAMSQGIVQHNPCENAIIPECKVQEKKKRVIEFADLNEFLDLFKEEKELDRVVHILLHTGMREGELLGLRWQDIDFNNREISIKNTLSYASGTGLHLSTPKTKDSARIIYMDDTTVKLFKNQRKAENEKRLALGSEFLHPEMAFTSLKGNYKNVYTLIAQLNKRVENTKFEDVTFHWLRHTSASLLFRSGHSSKEIQYQLGHSNTRTTENIYIDLMEDSKKRVSLDLENCLAQ